MSLRLHGANVVNGAQTVASIREAMRRDDKMAAMAKVWVRLISLENVPDGFANEITVKTNTQNSVGVSDFVALDETQPRLRDEFAMSLGLSYIVKRGDKAPEHDKGCTLQDAATALACADREVDTMTRAKQDVDSLFETGERSVYSRLFNDNVNAYLVWRSVQTLRTVQGFLAERGQELDGRGAQIAKHGDLAVAHLVFRRLNRQDMANPDARWEEKTLPGAADLAERALRWLMVAVDEHLPNAYIQSIFKNEDRVRQLIKSALPNLMSVHDAPQPPQKYRKTSGIDIIVNRRLIEDGAEVEFRAANGQQRKLLVPWLKADGSRGRANWVNDRTRPLVWAFDGKRYSPNDLTKFMLGQVMKVVPRVNGQTRWFIPERGSLAEIAARARNADSE